MLCPYFNNQFLAATNLFFQCSDGNYTNFICTINVYTHTHTHTRARARARAHIYKIE